MSEFNLFSAARAAVPVMLERGGSIVNVSSVHARYGSSVNVDYSAAKAAMTSLSKALSEEFGPRGIPGEHRHAGADFVVDSAMIK